MPNMDNTIYYIIGAIHSTVQSFLFQLQSLIQMAFLVAAGFGLRSYMNRNAVQTDTATTRVLEMMTDQRPINQNNRLGNGFNANGQNAFNNFNALGNNLPNANQNGFVNNRFTNGFTNGFSNLNG